MAPRHGFKFKNPLYSLDSTVIELCLRPLPWARHTRKYGALKLHYGLDHSGNIPNFLHITTGSHGDITVARKHWPIIPDSINCFDRGYLDFEWFRRIHDGGAFFVTRARKSLIYRVAGQQKKPENTGVTCDRIIELPEWTSGKAYPYRLRLISFSDRATGRSFRFLTNNFELPADVVADVYKARWQIEAFFKWVKQNLKIKTFLGTNKNAVLSQVWVAMCYFLLLAYIKFQTRYSYSLFYLHRIIRETLLDRLSLVDVLRIRESALSRIRDPEPQLAFAF